MPPSPMLLRRGLWVRMPHGRQSHQQDQRVVVCPLMSPKPCMAASGRNRGRRKASEKGVC